MRPLSILYILCFLLACSTGQAPKDEEGIFPSNQTANGPGKAKGGEGLVQILDSNQTESIFYVQDSSQYATVWLEDLRKFHSGLAIELMGDTLILEKGKKPWMRRRLPYNLEVGKVYRFANSSLDTRAVLTIKRFNYSSIAYEYKDLKLQQKGIAHIVPYFVMASGTYVQENGLGNGIHEYYDKSTEGCTIYVKVGLGKPKDAFFYQVCKEGGVLVDTPLLSIVE